ncbi:MAG: DegT/DnrJ/EryC1/StrS family aminotransferase [Verrucomicrobia bacterium]|nr:MAG: DegT/DnrJ/EryC1/StrS family aminotransferase [Verrucomicrobiota bacterium]
MRGDSRVERGPDAETAQAVLQNDFKRQWAVIGPAVRRAVERVGASGWYILGQEVEAFETTLANAWQVAYAVGTANGMDAIEVGLRCLKLRPGEKVLTTSLSAFATSLAIIRAGGQPVFVDVDECGLIDLGQCHDILSRDRSIRVFVPVHLYGFPLDLIELRKLRDEFGLRMVEDCAQAIGAKWHDIAVGTIGQVAATSFYPTKNLGALGDGGALLTNDEAIRDQARCLRNYGQSSLYHHTEAGLNSRLDELHAAILRDALLPHLVAWIEARREVAQAYRSRIVNPLLRLPVLPDTANAAWHLFPVQVASHQRDQFRDCLIAQNIRTGIHYPRIIPDQAAMAELAHEVAFEPDRARRIALSEISLPIHPFLTEREIEKVVDACNRWQP